MTACAVIRKHKPECRRMQKQQRTNWLKWCALSLIGLAVGLGASNWYTSTARADDAKPVAEKKDPAAEKKDPAVEQARKTVRMLDDLYKTTIVLVTQTYVEDESSTPGITAAMALWDAMEKKGWHKVRLVDATGEPYDSDNVAKSAFEKSAIKKLTAKQGYFDTVVTENGKRYLEAVTQVPVVMDKCIMCHANYKDVPAGATIGAVSYRIPIEE